MAKKLPPFQKMWDNYPKSSSKDVIDLIFAGKHNYKWIKKNIKNTCTIRLSRALNYSGDPIMKTTIMSVLLGNDNKWYGYRVREMRSYLESRYGSPIVSDESSSAVARRSAVSGKQGIIIFRVRGWEDATEHTDIWNRGTVRYKDYFTKAYQVQLWSSL